MNESFEFDEVERITVGTVGKPGQRVFLLQATSGATTVTLKLEKSQVSALSKYLGELLKALPRPGHLPDDLDLAEPVEPAWVIGSLGITYDEAMDRLLLIAEEANFDDEELELAEARFVVTREQMAALAIRGAELVESGRPTCPLCGYPLDPKGHACPRTNGHRAPTL